MNCLVVIDGLDGSGKTTQLNKLGEYLKNIHKKYRQISFPDYDKPSSTLVKMYLDGSFGDAAEQVNAYAASSFYAVDRYASFKLCWEHDYLDGVPILAARYVSSNAIHQMVKLEKTEWDSYLAWLSHYEYDLLGLPRPDKIIFLDMPPHISQKLMTVRYGGDEQKKDIHERDFSYLQRCREAALYAAEKENWCVIRCDEDGEARSRKDIMGDIVEVLNDIENF